MYVNEFIILRVKVYIKLIKSNIVTHKKVTFL